MPLTPPTYPAGMDQTNLEFASLIDTLVGDEAFFGTGSYTAVEFAAKYDTKQHAISELGTYLDPIGELAETPAKVDSKSDRLKTRNYAIPGKRTTTYQVTLNGMSAAQKDYFESSLFSGQVITIVLASNDRTRVTVLNGLRWTVDWSGEADGLWTVTINTEFSGVTKDKIFLAKGLT